MPPRRTRTNLLPLLPWARITTSPEKSAEDIRRMAMRNTNFGIARVTNVDYAEFFVTLRIVTGGEEFDRVPVPLALPGAGARHFFGALPQIGDFCVVGFMTGHSPSGERGTRTPVILNWLIPGVWPGQEWETIAGFPVDEIDLGNPKDRAIVAGVFERIRHKLRHAQPGNIIASSAQGADLVLDEGVTLSNRRGGELRLRDQDNALIVRSLQQFHAMAGVRSYTGMVQRDADVLPTAMVSDGRQWDGPEQARGGFPIRESELPESEDPSGRLTPARIFGRSDTEDGQSSALHRFSPNLDPYQFLRRGGMIDETGYATRDLAPDAVYGGKPIFRVASNSEKNAVLDPKVPTLVEHRLELHHTSDGTLPVTEQTDLLDIERLPSGDSDTPSLSKRPFIEVVFGSVIGNDPYRHIDQYGLPLVPQVFRGDTVAPQLERAQIGVAGSGQATTPIGDHGATLFLLRPPGGEAETFWSVNKRGQLKAFLGGTREGNSVEVATTGGLRLAVGGKFDLSFNEGVSLQSAKGDNRNNVGVNLGSQTGAVRIFGGGALKGGEATATPSKSLPSVEIEAATGMRLVAQGTLQQRGQTIAQDAATVVVRAGDELSLKSANRLELASQDFALIVAGKRTDTYAGPKQGLPTSGPLHEEIYSPSVPGLIARRTLVIQGDIESELRLGSQRTTVKVGDITFDAVTGKIVHQAGPNTMTLDQTGLEGSIQTGHLTLTAVAGSAEFRGVSSVTVSSEGVATLRGRSVYLGAPVIGPDQGGIICAGSLDPFTGLPFASFGMGATNHIVGS